MRVQEVEQHAHVLQAGVHALPVEGYHRVRGVADDNHAAAVVVRRAFDVDERQVRVRGELGDQLRRGDEVRAQTGEVLVEEGWQRGLRRDGQRGEGGGRCEQRAGEGAVQRRDGDEHKGRAGPDVQVVRRDGERGVGGKGRDVELAPQRVDVLLLVVDARELHKVVAGGGVGAVGADEEVEVDFLLGVALVLGGGGGRLGRILGVVGLGRVGAVLEPGGVAVEVRAGELVVEEEGHIGHGFQGVEEAFVEPRAVDGVD